VDDLDALERDFDRETERLGERAERLVRATTLRTEALAKARAPVRTGFLKSSITSEFDMTGKVKQGIVGPEASYSAYVEFGTRRMAPRPYLYPAADVVEPEFFAAAEAIAAEFGRG